MVLFDILRRNFHFRSKKTGKIFFGWYTVLASAISDAWQSAAWIYGFGIFFKPLMSDFGWTRAQTAAASSFGRMEGALEGPFAGMATDRFGPKPIYLIGAFLAGLGFCLMYFINSLVMFYIVWVITAVGFNLGWSRSLDTAIANWFVKKRGTVLSLARLGRVIGGSILTPFLSILLIRIGWRVTFIILGLLSWVIGGFIGMFMVKKQRPEYYGLLPDGEEYGDEETDTASLLKAGEEYSAQLGEYEFNTWQALKTRAFLMLTLGALLTGMIFPAVSVHIVPHLTDMGMDPVVAAAALGFMVLMSMPGRLIGGIVADRLPKDRIRYLMVLSAVSYALGMLILLVTKTVSMVFLYLFFFGMGIGLNSTSNPVLIGRYYGRKRYGTISGSIAMIGLPVSLISPIFAGWMYDVTGSYAGAFKLSLFLAAFGIIFYVFAKPPDIPEQL